jgi:hypothetical protein
MDTPSYFGVAKLSTFVGMIAKSYYLKDKFNFQLIFKDVKEILLALKCSSSSNPLCQSFDNLIDTSEIGSRQGLLMMCC